MYVYVYVWVFLFVCRLPNVYILKEFSKIRVTELQFQAESRNQLSKKC